MELEHNREIPSDLYKITGTPALIAYWQYPCESHIVSGSDGYHIQLFRIPHGKNGTVTNKYPVLLWHGLANSSELFVAGTPECSLAYVLADAGFDVWLANTRGSKYSYGHDDLDLSVKKDRQRYWNYSIDEMALFDVPAVVDFILEMTGHCKISYIGFSQGSAKAFAALSLSEELNHKINRMIGLAPAMKPKKVKSEAFNTVVDYCGGNRFLFNLLGKGCFMPIAEYLPGISLSLNRFLIKAVINNILKWKMDKLGSIERQDLLYKNLFSTTSVQNFVHWFQIMGNERFAMYEEDDDVSTIPAVNYPTKHITTQITLFCGLEDNISDPEYLKTKLPPHAEFNYVPYEHLDFVFAHNAKTLVWDSIIDILNQDAGVKSKKMAVGPEIVMSDNDLDSELTLLDLKVNGNVEEQEEIEVEVVSKPVSTRKRKSKRRARK
ncbi:Alpha/Beta hydrolase protein [Globomyces pollinis-pini]|nr:Alpha/Beta hydrolase protein [Globomyces pollinis-pini]